MKRITIKQMHLVNFKAFRDFTIDFNSDVTEVRGQNALGKTTIFDAFTYVLFGKDSQGRTQFNLKTLGQDGKPIERLPHEVSAILDVDGEEVRLTRRFKEKWVKRRGSSVEEFTGHEEERLYNDIPLTLREWSSKIDAICPEAVFRMITSPSYFCSMKPDHQRPMLVRMAGEIEDSDIAEGHDDFKKLLEDMSGKTMDEFRRELGAKKKRIKDSIDPLPARIDERKTELAAIGEPDFKKAESDLKEKSARIAEIDAQMNDISKRVDEVIKANKQALEDVSDVQKQIEDRKYEIRENALKEYRKARSEASAIDSDIQADRDSLERSEKRVVTLNEEIKKRDEIRASLLEEFKSARAEKLVIGEDAFVCPVCHQQYKLEQIESRREQMEASFNKEKAERLEEINNKGKSNNQQKTWLQEDLDDEIKKQAKLKKEIEELEAKRKALAVPDSEPDTTKDIANDAKLAELNEKLAELEKKAKNAQSSEADEAETAKLKEEKSSLSSEIEELKATLRKKDDIKRNNDRIAELEAEFKKGNAELAELEGMEMTADEFSRAKMNAVKEKVDAMFKIVRWKLFDVQINGGIAETCEATVDGVPYSDLNSAMKINAGLDIINTLCQCEGIEAPIFVDNAESIVDIMPTNSQMILLRVTEDDSLIIK